MRNRTALVSTAVLSVALWIVGLVVSQGTTSNLADNASDAHVLHWVQSNKNPILLGSWLFMIGCVTFLAFAALLRGRLAAAEGGDGTFSSLVFAGCAAVAVLGIGTQADIGTAINASDVTPSTAGTLHHLGDLFFVGAELMLVAALAGSVVLAFRTRVLPRWWAILSGVVAVVLLIGPIGWAALIFGLPVWTLGTSLLVGRAPARRAATTPAVA
jgi:hypothetical protein